MKPPQLILCLLLLFTSYCRRTTLPSQDYTPKFILSDEPPVKISKGQNYQFGYLEVPENRSIKNGKTIKLPVYIFKSRNSNPQPDPIIYTLGGPGSTTMTSAPYMNYYRYLDDRDFILFEQRGNYYAQPHLDCPEWSAALQRANQAGFDQNQRSNLLVTAARDCRKRLVAKGIDLNAYHTNEIAADIVDLRRALKIQTYNLLTLSYSTKIAQVLLRDYPEGIRSVVMDSPLPLESKYDEESNKNLMETLDLFFSTCSADSKCSQRFPNLKDRFFDFLENCNKVPLEVEVKNPATNKLELFYLRGADLVQVFSNATTSEVADIPLEMEKILNGNLTSIQNQLSSLFNPPGIGDGIGMRLSVWCAEEYPFSSQSIISEETNKYSSIKGLSPATYDAEICRIWSVKKVAKKEDQAIKSEVPVLLINGSYDELTPSKWARAMQQNLINSFHLVFPGWKHTPTTNWSNPCAMEAANDFFNTPTLQPKPPCLEDLKQIKFNLE